MRLNFSDLQFDYVLQFENRGPEPISHFRRPSSISNTRNLKYDFDWNNGCPNNGTLSLSHFALLVIEVQIEMKFSEPLKISGFIQYQ